jgi:hypothetical protein
MCVQLVHMLHAPIEDVDGLRGREGLLHCVSRQGHCQARVQLTSSAGYSLRWSSMATVGAGAQSRDSCGYTVNAGAPSCTDYSLSTLRGVS